MSQDSFPEPVSARRSLLPRWISFGLLPFLLALTLTLAVFAYRNHQQLVSALGGSGTAAAAGAQPSPLRQLMGLSDVPARAAPGFTLTDQHGRSLSLASLRGKPVLLAFLDSRCTAVCPVLAQEFALADHDLGALAAHVMLVGVNVNPMATSVADVAKFDQLHGLAALPNWHFLTGPVSQLRRVWAAYGITVIVPKGATQTTHADYLYFLTPGGQERYLASPQVDQRRDGTGYLPQPTLNQWGQGIATYLRRLASS